jgi:hypothetical protein
MQAERHDAWSLAGHIDIMSPLKCAAIAATGSISSPHRWMLRDPPRERRRRMAAPPQPPALRFAGAAAGALVDPRGARRAAHPADRGVRRHQAGHCSGCIGHREREVCHGMQGRRREGGVRGGGGGRSWVPRGGGRERSMAPGAITPHAPGIGRRGRSQRGIPSRSLGSRARNGGACRRRTDSASGRRRAGVRS